MIEKPTVVVILGPTASGKTRLAAQLAYNLDAEIVSADSRQIFKNLNIGAGKDYQDYVVNGKKIYCHLIDICQPEENYDLGRFLHDAKTALLHIAQRGKLPILCGGTGLYIKALLQDYSQTQIPVNIRLRTQLAQMPTEELNALYIKALSTKPEFLVLDGSTPKRKIRAIEMIEFVANNPLTKNENTGFQYVVFGLNPPLHERRELIAARLDYRLQNGLIEEVKALIENGVSTEKLIYLGLEYKFVTEFLLGFHTFERLKTRLTTAIQQFAKRQMTFFRYMEKEGITINWLSGGSDEIRLSEMVSALPEKITTPHCSGAYRLQSQ